MQSTAFTSLVSLPRTTTPSPSPSTQFHPEPISLPIQSSSPCAASTHPTTASPGTNAKLPMHPQNSSPSPTSQPPSSFYKPPLAPLPFKLPPPLPPFPLPRPPSDYPSKNTSPTLLLSPGLSLSPRTLCRKSKWTVGRTTSSFRWSSPFFSPASSTSPNPSR